MAKIPRPELWRDDHYVTVFRLARDGYTNREIAKEINVPLPTLEKWANTKPAFRNALNEGRKLGDFGQFTKGLSPSQQRFLAAYAECGVVTHASEAALVPPGSHNHWKKTSPEYAKAFRGVEQQAADALEYEARRRAVGGVKRYKFFKGQPILIPCEPDDPEAFQAESDNGEMVYLKHYCEVEYSDALLQLMLKAKRPKQFAREQIKIDNSTTNNNVQLTGDNLLSELVARVEDPTVIDGEYVLKEATAFLTDESNVPQTTDTTNEAGKKSVKVKRRRRK